MTVPSSCRGDERVITQFDSGAGPRGVRAKHLHATTPAIREAMCTQDEAMLNSPELIPDSMLLAILTLLAKVEDADKPEQTRGIRSFDPRFRKLIAMEQSLRHKRCEDLCREGADSRACKALYSPPLLDPNTVYDDVCQAPLRRSHA